MIFNLLLSFGTVSTSVGAVFSNLKLALLGILLPLVVMPSLVAQHSASPVAFHLSAVRLLDSPFKQAERVDREYIMALDPDRLLAPFRREAGLPSKKTAYTNWENTGLDGHIGGHYLSALAMLSASTEDQEVGERLQYVLDELQLCQNHHPHGYLGGVPGSSTLWSEIRAGDIRADNFSLNNKWVPWYNLHKTFAGLRDAHLYAGSDQALEMLIHLADWAVDLLAGLSDEQLQTMLRTEHGGMNEVLADVYALTDDPRYLDLADRLSHRQILDPLLRAEDQLTGLHANTQIPKVVGFERVAELADRPDWLNAAAFFWETVVDHRTVAIGGNSVREHFHPSDDFSSMINSVEGPETCNTYNMLRLSKALFLKTRELQYLDYYERALYNHILSSQHPENGGFVYFTPLRPRHYRVYSQVHTSFWCCVGSGLENHTKYGELIYAHTEDELMVNLFIPSILDWQEKGVQLIQSNSFPDEDRSTIHLKLDAPTTFDLLLRYPGWAVEGQMEVRINGEIWPHNAAPGEYLSVRRQWTSGDIVEVRLPMQLALEQLPDQSSFYALRYGPIVLAANMGEADLEGLYADDSRMGHIARGLELPLQEAPLLVGNPEQILSKLQRVEGQSLRFRLAEELIHPTSATELEWIPFFRLHDARYQLYWQITSATGLADLQAEIAAEEAARQALAARIIDQVAPGEQQPEADHFFAAENSESGLNMNRHWRHAAAWFSYQLKDPDREADLLRITYFGADSGRRFDILINETTIAEVELKGEYGAEFVDIDYPIPADLHQEDGSLIVKFQAKPGSIAGGIYGVQLLRGE